MTASYDAGGGSAGTEAAPEAAAPQDFAAEADRSQEEAAAEEGGGSSVVDAEAEVADRSLIHIADLTVRVDDVAEAAQEAKELAAASGGHVASESLSTPTGGTPEAYLTLRIPNEGYEGALEDLAGLGDRSDLNRSVEDVTGEVADVESRIESAETALETLRGYLQEADDVDELLRVEREIQDRQAELEAFQARLKTLEDQTTLSTVNLTLVPPQTYIEEPSEDSIGFLGGLERGWRALVSVFEGLAVALGWLLPFAVVLAVPVTALVWWLRRRRRSAAQAPRVPVRAGAPGAPTPPAPGTAAAGTPAPAEAAGTGEAAEDTAPDETDEASGTGEPTGGAGTTGPADGTEATGTGEAAGRIEGPEATGTAGSDETDGSEEDPKDR
ncbi:DUF4349 domain-containing protein [Nocardiopsis sp. NPDC057823]|uniref:DUF4349 domain-containing protein n=1 Tax=Nocardiopsis sp. NPDC057823 TaxID=3346256 RepID=UPI00366E9FAB